MKTLLIVSFLLLSFLINAQNVGIGTTSPQSRLHVRIFSSGGTFHTNATASFESQTTNFLQLSNPSTSISGILSGTNLTQQRSSIFFNADSSIQFVAGGTLNFMKLYNNGYLGINQAIPTSRLHVSNGASGNITSASSRIATFEDNSSTYLQLLTPSGSESGILAGNASTLIKSGIVFTADSSISLRTGGNNTRMFITDNGNVGINTGAPLAMLHVKDGDAVFTAPTTLPSSFSTPPVSGAGTRMMWWPAKAAFRAGTVTGTYWDYSLIGKWSFAGGLDCIADGDYSAAFGYSSQVNGDYAAAFGNDNNASGSSAFAIGHSSWALGDNSFTGGYDCFAGGAESFAFGYQSVATGPTACAIGVRAYSSGSRSAAFGYEDTASGANSSAFGAFNNAKGTNSFTAGSGLVAGPYNTIALGSYNKINTASSTIPSPYVPLLVVGTGDDDTHRENGMEIYRGGSVYVTNLRVNSKVLGSLTPDDDDSYKLGSSSFRWKEVWSANPFLQSSDVRLKTNIKPLRYGLETVMAMQPVSYNMKKNLQQTELGFLAQDMEKLVPEVVVSPEGDGMKAMKYSSLIPVLVQSIKDQQKIIESLEKRIKELEKKARK